jgi:hypothetical protein
MPPAALVRWNGREPSPRFVAVATRVSILGLVLLMPLAILTVVITVLATLLTKALEAL